MARIALFVRLDAKPGKEKDVEQFLLANLPVVQEAPATNAGFAIRLGPSTFGIFDAFPNAGGWQALLTSKMATDLMAKAPELLAKLPSIEKVGVLTAKLS